METQHFRMRSHRRGSIQRLEVISQRSSLASLEETHLNGVSLLATQTHMNKLEKETILALQSISLCNLGKWICQRGSESGLIALLLEIIRRLNSRRGCW